MLSYLYNREVGMKILVCGGRDFNNQAIFNQAMEHYIPKTTLVIHGAAKGADTLADNWAKENGLPIEAYPANWDKYGKRAGYIRNVQMLNEGKPDMVIAFPGGKGTEMMINLAHAAKVPVWEILI